MVKWINHATIAAPRNATTTHTVTPSSGTVAAGALFTPTAGNLLVCLVEGAVTSTTPTGWTLPSGGSAVNNTGLYLWYRTAAGGGDSLTTTHNGSNYPLVFDFYELPAGTTFLSAASATAVASGGAGPSLSGLSATANLRCAVAAKTVANATLITFTWSTGTEAVDTSVAFASSTDGYGYSLAYVEDATTATFSSAATDTGPSTQERIVFALNVAASGGSGTTPVSKSVSTTWRALARTTGTRATTWRAVARITATRSTLWDVLTSLASSRATTWRVRAATTATRSTTWRTLAASSAARSTTWNTKAAVSGLRATTWRALTVASVSRSTTWRTLSRATVSRATTWNVGGSLATIVKTVGTTWRVLTRTSPTRSTTWTTKATVAGSRSTSWNVASALVTVVKTAATTWRTLARPASTRPTGWRTLGGVAKTTSASWRTAVVVSATRAASWRALGSVRAVATTTWQILVDTSGFRDVTVLAVTEITRDVEAVEVPRPVAIEQQARPFSAVVAEGGAVRLNRTSREFYTLTITTDPPVSGWEASFDGGTTWVAGEPTIRDANTWRWLVAGPAFVADATPASILAATSVPMLRAVDTPEVLVRRGPTITIER